MLKGTLRNTHIGTNGEYPSAQGFMVPFLSLLLSLYITHSQSVRGSCFVQWQVYSRPEISWPVWHSGCSNAPNTSDMPPLLCIPQNRECTCCFAPLVNPRAVYVSAVMFRKPPRAFSKLGCVHFSLFLLVILSQHVIFIRNMFSKHTHNQNDKSKQIKQYLYLVAKWKKKKAVRRIKQTPTEKKLLLSSEIYFSIQKKEKIRKVRRITISHLTTCQLMYEKCVLWVHSNPDLWPLITKV